MEKNFCSDNCSGVCPEVMAALAGANQGHVPSYGNDELTAEADPLVKAALGRDCEIFYVYNGTAANTLACKAVLRSIDSIICAETSHIVTHEVAAPINATGSKIITVPDENGKITPALIRKAYENEAFWGQHATRPRLVTITQATEFGTVYTLEELAAIKAICDELGMLLHMDGCRLYNAAVYLNCSLADLCEHVDVLSLGGTKNGLMFGEALVFFNKEAADGFLHLRKQGLQLHSKMRFITAQFVALFTDELWKKNASQANKTALRLAEGVIKHPEIELHYPVQTNQIFLKMPEELAKRLMQVCDFAPFGMGNVYRMVTSYDTTMNEVEFFLGKL